MAIKDEDPSVFEIPESEEEAAELQSRNNTQTFEEYEANFRNSPEFTRLNPQTPIERLPEGGSKADEEDENLEEISTNSKEDSENQRSKSQ